MILMEDSGTNYSLQCRHVYKTFGKNKVLKDINLDVVRGEVHALLGQNGAGKSTLVKILTGVYTRDSGDVIINGEAADIQNPRDAEKYGIAIIHQDQQMVPFFDVTRNAFLGTELKTPAGILDFKTMTARVTEKLELIKASFSANEQISNLSVGQREQVAIAAALLKDPKILILDEPTASLSNREVDDLFEIIANLKKHGVTIIYISHHLDEVFQITDTITILRDSCVQGTFVSGNISQEEVVSTMIGKKLEEFFPKDTVTIGSPLLEVKNLSDGKVVKDVSFTLNKGEILGFAGLVGAGRSESMLDIYGIGRNVTGDITLDGVKYKPISPWNAKKRGIAFIPEDRRNEGIVKDLTISQNLALAFTKQLTKWGIISKTAEIDLTNVIVKELNISCEGYSQIVEELSGGNQQKVVIGRWLKGNSKIFVFDQPTTGVDVGAKTEIYKQMVKLAKSGCGVIFISSENEELLGMCDRFIVMSKGKVIKELSRSEATEEKLLFWASGGE
jgi:ribose transport system ATP-binding protein